MAAEATQAVRVRGLMARDLDDVVRIDALHTGVRKRGYWQGVFAAFVRRRPGTVALAADAGGRLAGFLVGEVRAFEFGSAPCGWVFAVGVDRAWLRTGVGSALLDAAVARFGAAGVTTVRTMVKRNDVPVLAFFRARGFVGGTFVELELTPSGEIA